MGRTPEGWYDRARGCWRATVRGRRHTLAVGPEREMRAAARRELRRLLDEPGPCPQAQAPSAGLTLDELAGAFLREIERTRAADTLRAYTTVVKGFVLHCGRETPAASVRPWHLLAWFAAHEWKPSTEGYRTAVLRWMFAWGRKAGHLDTDPVKDAARPGAGERRKVMSPEQAEAFLAATRGPFHDFVLALAETGCRPGEIATLTADRVDLEGRLWRVRNKTRRATGEPTRAVYLSDAALELTRRLLADRPEGCLFRNARGGPWRESAWVQRFEKLGRRLGYGPECTAYSYRHLWITRALIKGIPPTTVAELVGHTGLKMVASVYNQVRDRADHLREAARTVGA